MKEEIKVLIVQAQEINKSWSLWLKKFWIKLIKENTDHRVVAKNQEEMELNQPEDQVEKVEAVQEEMETDPLLLEETQVEEKIDLHQTEETLMEEKIVLPKEEIQMEKEIIHLQEEIQMEKEIKIHHLEIKAVEIHLEKIHQENRQIKNQADPVVTEEKMHQDQIIQKEEAQEKVETAARKNKVEAKAKIKKANQKDHSSI